MTQKKERSSNSQNQKKSKTKRQYVNLDCVGEIQNIEVAINGEKTPISIGDKILFSEEDRLVKTVAAIRIEEDGRVCYMLEWYDPADISFKQEWLSMTELKLFQESQRAKGTIKLN